MNLLEAKAQSVAQIIEGRVVPNVPNLAVSIQGSVLGFPVTIQAIGTKWPFPTMYFLETKIIEDPQHPAEEPLMLTIAPRMGKGILSYFTRIVLFEPMGMGVGNKKLESSLLFHYNSAVQAERFVQYPAVAETLDKLNRYCKFSEIKISSREGIYLAQPKSFEALDLDVCRQTVKYLGELGQVLFDVF
jgi:hypothetical protein